MTTQIGEVPSEEQFGVASDMLKLLADPTRLALLWALLHGEHSVNNLAAHVGVAPASVSQHLAKLRLARLVKTRRQGTFVYYLVENAHVRRLVEEAVLHADRVVRGMEDHDGASAPAHTSAVGRRA
jgi:DNA-binding transcriptional ArsR family regulator